MADDTARARERDKEREQQDKRRERARREAARLDIPGPRPRTLLPRMDADTFGSFAETFARFMGTPAFLLWMTVFVVTWVFVNVVGVFGLHFDPYPFILLNLFFSTQASYSAPLILLAQNRQEDRDRLALEEDRRVAAQSRADMDFLAREIASLRRQVGELATRDYLRSELRDLLADIERTGHRIDQVRDDATPPARPSGA